MQERKAFYVDIDLDVFRRLQVEAQRERRGVRDQAAVILSDVLRPEQKTSEASPAPPVAVPAD